MTRFIGPTGSRRRLGTLIGAIFSALVLGAFLMPSAQAVHDLGIFELEGDATNNPAVAGDDWDNVCHEVTGTDCSTTSNTSGATAVAWAADGSHNATIFTGGGSKDPQDISNWRWKDGAGGLPDKDNLEHAFAARYTAPVSGDDILYFGSDRFDNSGDAQEGFWFFQNEITLNANGTFSGVHQAGDLLILSDFSNGGSVSTINIYKWVDSGGDTSTHLDFLAGGDAARCRPALTNDEFCGVVNPTNGTVAPWSFTDKSGNHTYLNGEFYEGGVNLSSPDINLGGECFASIASETRSSTSPTATLKDFVLGGFGQCTSSVSSEQSWTPNDSGSVDVQGATTWSGTLAFTLYDDATCTGNVLYTEAPQNVSNANPTASTNNQTVDVTSSGTFSWKVDFDSATTRVPDSSSCTETSDLTITN